MVNLKYGKNGQILGFKNLNFTKINKILLDYIDNIKLFATFQHIQYKIEFRQDIN